jgi:DNA-binding MarR family transcriptional regulator
VTRLREEIHQARPFSGLEEEAFLCLQRTAGVLLAALSRSFRGQDLTPAQYNVLRILRGAGPGGLTCGEIGERLVTPGPDVTRLLDRLERAGLVVRMRDSADRRVVRARIEEKGLALLAELDRPVQAALQDLLGPMGEEKLARLVQLLDEARSRAS